MQRFYKGRTNNHLSWVMVDATDFATPESALSAATKIKIYGKLRGAAGVNFVSSGTGSLTNDITHVGASALGIYSIGLVKADLSDASAAWYDQYIISLSATGAAYQALIVDGGIDASAILAMSAMLSDAHSAAILAASNASEAQSHAALAASRVLLVQSRLSDFNSVYTSDISDIRSMLTALSDAISDAHSDLGSKIGGITASVSASDISDIASAVWANTIGARVDSRVLLNLSRVSDVYSLLSDLESNFGSRVPKLVATNSQLSDAHSDLASKIAGITASVSASDISDIASAVWANAIGARIDSRVLLNLSRVSDVYSLLSDLDSNFGSRVPKLVATNSQLSDAHSDLASKIAGITATVTASDMSDIASRVDVLLASRLSDILSAAQQANSRVLVAQSMISDTYSQLSNAISGPMTASDLSDIASAVWANAIGARVDSRLLLVQSRVSDVNSALAAGVSLDASTMSDLRSAITAGPAGAVTASDISDIASAVWANATRTLTSNVALNASDMSDLRSAIAAGPAATVTASDMSDIASRVDAVLASRLSDILSAAQQANSRVLVAQSQVSDVYSLLSDLQSDFGSRVPKRVATDSQLSDLVSDLRSALAAGVSLDASTMSDLRSAISAGGGASILSDILSAAVQTNSRVLLNQSRVSDIYSLLSDLHSDVGVISGVVSDIYSGLAPIASAISDVESQIDAGIELGASTMSDLRSAVTANGVNKAGADITGVVGVTGTLAEKVDFIAALARNKVTETATVQTVYNDALSAVISAAVSDDATTFTRGEWAG